MNMGIFLFISVFFNYIHQGPLFFLLLFSTLSASQQILPILQALSWPSLNPSHALLLGHFPCTIVHIEEIFCLCTQPKTKTFLWTVPCQIYLGCMNVRLEKHCLEYSWFLINYFKRINDKNSALGRVL